MPLSYETDKKWCCYCQRYTWFYRYPEGASRQWICECCANSWGPGGGYR